MGPLVHPVTPEVTTVTIRARHQCHLLWDTVGELTVYRQGDDHATELLVSLTMALAEGADEALLVDT